MDIEKLLWNVKEAGTALGLSPWTIRRWITDGKLTPVRLGGACVDRTHRVQAFGGRKPKAAADQCRVENIWQYGGGQ